MNTRNYSSLLKKRWVQDAPEAAEAASGICQPRVCFWGRGISFPAAPKAASLGIEAGVKQHLFVNTYLQFTVLTDSASV